MGWSFNQLSHPARGKVVCLFVFNLILQRCCPKTTNFIFAPIKFNYNYLYTHLAAPSVFDLFQGRDFRSVFTYSAPTLWHLLSRHNVFGIWVSGWTDGGWTSRWRDVCMDGRKVGWVDRWNTHKPTRITPIFKFKRTYKYSTYGLLYVHAIPPPKNPGLRTLNSWEIRESNLISPH